MHPCAPTADGLRGWLPWTRWLAAALLLAASAAELRGDVVRLLCDNHEAAQARVDLIQAAQAEINVASFSIADDEIGRGFLALLRDAARRGVAVRVLVDGLNNHIPESIQRHLLACGVQLRAYHPLQCTRPLWVNRRLHDKLVIVDGCELIVGSRNLDNRNFGLACRNFIDADAYVRGCAAGEARDYFLCVWRSDEVRPLDPDALGPGSLCPCVGPGDGPACPACALNRALQSLVARGFIATAGPARDWAADEPEAAEVFFLRDQCGRKNQPGAISDQLLQLLGEARSSIILESPYLVFSKRLKDVLSEVRSRGVEVMILTNSLASTDQTLVYAAYLNQRQEMMARGVEFWEYAGCDHFHAKTVLVDGCISVIGSHNFDPRSEHLNTETAIVSRDACVADDVIAIMAEHFANAWRIGPDGKPVGADARHPGVDRLRLQQLRAARAVAPLIKRHL